MSIGGCERWAKSHHITRNAETLIHDETGFQASFGTFIICTKKVQKLLKKKRDFFLFFDSNGLEDEKRAPFTLKSMKFYFFR